MKISWSQFEKDIRVLARKITERYDIVFDSIYPLFTDDYILVVCLSWKLQNTPVVTSLGKKSLILTTYNALLNDTKLSTKHNSCVLFYSKENIFKPTIYGILVPKNKSLVMPWHNEKI